MRRRALTAGEFALARSVFADAIRLKTVRILSAPWQLTRAFVPGCWFGRDWIVWPAKQVPDDAVKASTGVQAMLIHELVHVWQAQQGVNLLVAKIRAGDSAASYRYPLDCVSWEALNIEQQASLIEHRFRRSKGQGVPGDAAFYDRLCPFPKPSVSNPGLE
ncbi:hypothetical protein ACO2Q1_13615 [Brevundimonas sp. VNH65]|uniref:hypothetical protein n=1 Tax=Brevundimonas sp. VNH65 TaxID=3400917 RepID=UPI003BFC2303